MAACAFCEIIAGERSAHVVLDDDIALAFLDVRPLFPGHTLVVPKVHHETLADLPDDLVGPLFGRVKLMARAMEAALGAQGSFVAQNNRVSQSVPHVHVHVVPRTRGDGLRGFFWPRARYGSDDEAAAVARRLARTIDALLDQGSSVA
ncbi:MAG: HIT family protein [Acidimicrobiales bacterium]